MDRSHVLYLFYMVHLIFRFTHIYSMRILLKDLQTQACYSFKQGSFMKDADQIRIAPGSVFLSKQEAVSWYRAENAAGHKFPELSETLRRALRFYFP